MTQVSF